MRREVDEADEADEADAEEHVDTGSEAAAAHMARWFAALPPGLAEALSLDESDLSGEFIRFAGTFAYWSERYADAERDAEAADQAADKARSIAFLVVAEQNTKRAKADRHARPLLDALAEQNSALAAAQAEALDRRQKAMRYKGYVEALRAKRDMLVQLGARRRAELGVTEPRIRE